MATKWPSWWMLIQEFADVADRLTPISRVSKVALAYAAEILNGLPKSAHGGRDLDLSHRQFLL
jgi:hypothetical protein